MIINLIGASGSGKTTLAYKLQEELGSNINIIQSYTTRPKRHKKEKGHIFLKDANLIMVDGTEYSVKTKDKTYLIEKMPGYSFGKYIYFATEEQFLDDKINIYIVDPLNATKVKEYFKGKRKVVNVYLETDETIREKRIVKSHLKRNSDEGNINSCIDYQKALELANERLGRFKKRYGAIKTDYVVNNNSDIEITLAYMKIIISQEFEEILKK